MVVSTSRKKLKSSFLIRLVFFFKQSNQNFIKTMIQNEFGRTDITTCFQASEGFLFFKKKRLKNELGQKVVPLNCQLCGFCAWFQYDLKTCVLSWLMNLNSMPAYAFSRNKRIGEAVPKYFMIALKVRTIADLQGIRH